MICFPVFYFFTLIEGEGDAFVRGGGGGGVWLALVVSQSVSSVCCVSKGTQGMPFLYGVAVPFVVFFFSARVGIDGVFFGVTKGMVWYGRMDGLT